MALQLCPECKHEVSDQATSCPRCGHPLADWYYADLSNRPIGPLSKGGLAELIQSGTIKPATSVTRAGRQWSDAWAYQELRPFFTVGPRPSVVRDSILISFGLLLLTGFCWYALDFDSPSTNTRNAQSESRPPEETPATALVTLVDTAAREDFAESALRLARDLVARYPGTPEAQKAEEMIPDLEVRAAAEKEAIEARRLASKWHFSSYVDPMTSQTARRASIQSENMIELNFPYEGKQRGTLTLRKHPSHGNDVIFSIEQGQLLCSSWQECQIRVRFDEGPSQRWNAIGPNDNSTTAVGLRGYDRFLQQMRRSRIVRIQPGIYEGGEQIFEFHVGGFDSESWNRNVNTPQ